MERSSRVFPACHESRAGQHTNNNHDRHDEGVLPHSPLCARCIEYFLSEQPHRNTTTTTTTYLTSIIVMDPLVQVFTNPPPAEMVGQTTYPHKMGTEQGHNQVATTPISNNVGLLQILASLGEITQGINNVLYKIKSHCAEC
jgi:hypothetical protein